MTLGTPGHQQRADKEKSTKVVKLKAPEKNNKGPANHNANTVPFELITDTKRALNTATATAGNNNEYVLPDALKKTPGQITIPADWREIIIKTTISGKHLKQKLNPASPAFQKLQNEIGGLLFVIEENGEIIIQKDSFKYSKQSSTKQAMMTARLQKLIDDWQKNQGNKYRIRVIVKKNRDLNGDFDAI